MSTWTIAAPSPTPQPTTSPQPTAPPSPAPTSSPDPAAGDQAQIEDGLALLPGRARTSRGDRRVAFALPAGAFPDGIVLTITGKRVATGAVRTVVRGGRPTRVVVKLSRRARRVLARRHWLKLRLAVTARAPSAPPPRG